ncbi:MAG: hypothetical protein GC129_07195 [Proteobacteria bacterium]|nr:hypothetical protein [Pseudomonadota bacterium]
MSCTNARPLTRKQHLGRMRQRIEERSSAINGLVTIGIKPIPVLSISTNISKKQHELARSGPLRVSPSSQLAF